MNMPKFTLYHSKYKRVPLIATVFALLAVLLGRIHPIFALLAIVPASFLAYFLCDGISRMIFGKEFVFVSKFGLNTKEENSAIRRSDYILTLACAILAIMGMFIAGEECDRFHGTDIWKWDLPWFK